METKTFAKIIMEKHGNPIGYAGGLPSTRKGSNMRFAADRIFREREDVKKIVAFNGAHRRSRTEGWEWFFYDADKLTSLECPRTFVEFFRD